MGVRRRPVEARVKNRGDSSREQKPQVCGTDPVLLLLTAIHKAALSFDLDFQPSIPALNP